MLVGWSAPWQEGVRVQGTAQGAQKPSRVQLELVELLGDQG